MSIVHSCRSLQPVEIAKLLITTRNNSRFQGCTPVCVSTMSIVSLN
jgi:hypothetical protein